MQQRFCNCGQAIWVQYVCYGNMPVGRAPLEAMFTSLKDGDEVLNCCPHCGASLNINDLS